MDRACYYCLTAECDHGLGHHAVAAVTMRAGTLLCQRCAEHRRRAARRRRLIRQRVSRAAG